MTAKKVKIIAAVARLDATPHTQRRPQRIKQARQAKAWRRKQQTTANPGGKKGNPQ